MVFGDDNVMVFGDDSYYGFSIKDFEDDNQLTGFSVKLRMTKEDIKKEKKNGSPIKLGMTLE